MNPHSTTIRTIGLSALFACSMMLVGPARADTPKHNGQPTAQAPQLFGVIWRIRGEVTAEDSSGGKARALHEGSEVFVGNHIRASASGEAAIKTSDGGVVAIRPGADFTPESYAAEGKKSDHMILHLFTGSLRVISGWIGKINSAGDRIITPTATIGIRGTDHEPYVLSTDKAANTEYKPGTYDKVNRGKTTLGEGDHLLEIEPGRVGFARQPAFQAKGLMTILMPVLLDKVPGFYVPGAFDTELDQYSRTADAGSAQQLAQKRKTGADCDATRIAKDWLRRFDGAVAKLDAPAVMAQFASDVAIKANVRDNTGKMTSVEISRDEMAQSTVAAVKELKHYRQRRLTLDAKGADASCKQVSLNSQVIEQGEQSGKPYRFESTEEYLLEQRDGKWLAIKAETTQR